MVALLRHDIATESLPEFHDRRRAEEATGVQWTHVTPVSSLSPQIEGVLRRLQELRGLAPNWDSYGGVPPQVAAIEAAARLVEATTGVEDLVALNVAPVSRGGVQVEWGFDEREVEVEVQPDLTADVLLTERGETLLEKTGVRLERLDLAPVFRWLITGE